MSRRSRIFLGVVVVYIAAVVFLLYRVSVDIDPRYREPVYQVVGKWLKGVFPISTGLVISGLGQPQWLMEIDVIAVIPDDWQATPNL